MKSELQESPLNVQGNLPNVTRWDELQYFANISIEIASVFDENGCDVHFLNKGSYRNITNAAQLISVFQEEPNGYTPLNKIFKKVLSENRLIISCTYFKINFNCFSWF
jgi:hypothetical protein